MNDRFKFKAYNTSTGEFLNDVNNISDYSNIIDDKGKYIRFETHQGTQMLLYTLQPKNDWVFMQCTGLKDKNGTLIFEGDIIEVQYVGQQIPLFKNEYTNQPENERFAIVYDENLHQYRCENDSYKKTCEIHSLDFNKIQINTDNKLYEIIGNIYENRGLLECQR